MGGAIVPVADRMKAIQTALTSDREKALVRSLAPSMDIDRFITIALSEIPRNPRLQECTPISIVRSVRFAARLNLECDSIVGEVYLVPYYNKQIGQYECTPILGYKGMQKLAWRGGKVTNISAEPVYEADEFTYRLGTSPKIDHQPLLRGERGEITHYYAVAHVDGWPFPQFAVMTAAEVAAIKARSKAKDSGPWITDPIEMGRKTPLRRLWKRLPFETAILRAVEREEQVELGILEGIEDDQPGEGTAVASAPADAIRILEPTAPAGPPAATPADDAPLIDEGDWSIPTAEMGDSGPLLIGAALEDPGHQEAWKALLAECGIPADNPNAALMIVGVKSWAAADCNLAWDEVVEKLREYRRLNPGTPRQSRPVQGALS